MPFWRRMKPTPGPVLKSLTLTTAEAGEGFVFLEEMNYEPSEYAVRFLRGGGTPSAEQLVIRLIAPPLGKITPEVAEQAFRENAERRASAHVPANLFVNDFDSISSLDASVRFLPGRRGRQTSVAVAMQRQLQSLATINVLGTPIVPPALGQDTARVAIARATGSHPLWGQIIAWRHGQTVAVIVLLSQLQIEHDVIGHALAQHERLVNAQY